MNYSAVDLLLRLAPFLTMIVLKIVGTNFKTHLRSSLTSTLTERDLAENEGLLNSLEEGSLQVYHRDRISREFDFSIIATVIVFASSEYTGNNGLWGVTGVLSVILLLFTRRYFMNYLKNRAPNRYILKDFYQANFKNQTFRIYWGEVGFILADLIPMSLIIFAAFY